MIALQRQMFWLNRTQIGLGLFLLVGALAFWLMLYRPMTRRLGEIESQTKSTNAAILGNEMAARDLLTLRSKVKALEQQVNSRQLPEAPGVPKFIRDVTTISQGTGLIKFSCKPDDAKKQALCWELPIKLEFSGPFGDIATFLRQAEDMPRLSRTREMSLSTNGKNGNVDVRLTMSVFYADDR